jgi:hypothetical protein
LIISDYATWIRDLSQADPQFSRYVLTRSWNTWHYLHLIHYLTALLNIPADAELARTIRQTKPKALICRLNKGHFPKGLGAALGKLPRRHLHHLSYQRLLTLLAEPNAARILRHDKTITPRRLSLLAALKPDLRQRSLLDQLEQKEDIRKFEALLRGLARTCPSLSQAALQQKVLQKLDQEDDFDDTAWAVLANHAVFPPAPWSGDDRLDPIIDATGLRQTALRFRNCLRDYLDDILKREMVFYVYRGESADAAVLLTWDMLHGWVIEEMLGYRNRDLSLAVRRDIEARFAQADIVVKPVWQLSGCVFGIGFDEDDDDETEEDDPEELIDFSTLESLLSDD